MRAGVAESHLFDRQEFLLDYITAVDLELCENIVINTAIWLGTVARLRNSGAIYLKLRFAITQFTQSSFNQAL